MSSMQIKNVYTGTVSEVNPDKILTLEDLWALIESDHGVKKEHQLLLTGNSIQVKMELVVDGQRIYLFNKSLISESFKPTISQEPEPQLDAVPDSQQEIRSVVDAEPLFVARAKWAVNMLSKAEDYNQKIEQTIDEISVIKNGIEVAVYNLHNHSTQLERSYYHKEDFYKAFDKNYSKTAEWEASFEKLKQVKVVHQEQDNKRTLVDWLDRKELGQAFDECVSKRQECQSIMDQLSGQVIEVVNQGHSLENKVKRWANEPVGTNDRHDSLQYKEVMQDIKAVISRIQRDCEHVTTLTEAPSDVQTCQRLARLHKMEFLDQVSNSVEDMHQRDNAWLGQKREAQALCIEYLKQVSQIQYKTSLVRPKLNKLGQDLESAEVCRVKVAKSVDLPFLYGMFLIEQMRRGRWTENMKSLVSETAETIATWRNNELKQRKNWQRHYGSTFDEVRQVKAVNDEEQVPDAELTVNNANGTLDITAEQMEDYLNQLFSCGFMEPYEALKQEHEEMSKREERSKMTAAGSLMKSESVTPSAAAVNDSSSSKGLEQQRLLAQADAKVKSYANRIKKLEDLLYREQYNRRSSGDWSTSGTPIPPSNLSYIANGIPVTPPSQPNNLQMQAALANHSNYAAANNHSHNHHSASPGTDSKQYTQLLNKVKQLEEQHQKDMEKITRLETSHRDTTTKLDATNKEREAAEVVKRDLLGNLTTLESDFSKERRQLNQEISELKLRIEELEEDVEREGEKALELESKHEHEVQRLKKQLETVQQREREHNKDYSKELDQFIAQEHALKGENKQLRESNERYYVKSKDLSQRLYTSYRRSCELLECMGLQAQKEMDANNDQVEHFVIKRVRGISKRAKLGSSNTRVLSHDTQITPVGGGGGGGGGGGAAGDTSLEPCGSSGSNLNLDSTEDEGVGNDGDSTSTNPTILYWMKNPDEGVTSGYAEDDDDGGGGESSEDERYRQFTNEVYLDYDMFRDAVVKRFSDVEKLARKSQRYNERARRLEQDNRDKIAVRSFKQGDLALFLPTRDQAKAPNNNHPWAAFNINAPHYFLKPSPHHSLAGREWLVARILSVEERVVNRAADSPDDNPFDLSDGLKWHLLEAVEER